MKRRIFSTALAITMLLSLAAAVVPGALTAPVALAAVIDVYSGGSIQDAINSAAPGDTIVVHDGDYNGCITIDKALTVISENGNGFTKITSNSDYSCVQITASGVTFGQPGHGFGVFPHHLGTFAGIIAESYAGDAFTGITIEGNYVEGFDCGINLYNNDPGGTVSGCAIRGNEVYGCDYGITLDSDAGENHGNTVSSNEVYDCGYGISLIAYLDTGSVYGNTLTDNEVDDCEYGMYFQCGNEGGDPAGDVYDNTVSSNDITDCEDGIHIFCDESGNMYENTVSSNNIYNVDARGDTGIFVAACNDADFYGNTITLNTLYYWYDGIYFNAYDSGYIYDNEITGNTIHDCRDGVNYIGTGIYVESEPEGESPVHGNTIDSNTVYDCDYGIWMQARASGPDSGQLYDNAVTNNIVYGEGALSDFAGIYFLTTYDDVWGTSGHIHDCTVQGNEVYGWQKGIHLWNMGATTIEDTGILDNILYNGSAGNTLGIDIFGCNDIAVRGNDIAHSAFHAISIHASQGIAVGGNLIHDNVVSAEDLIYIFESSGVSVCGNDIRDNSAGYDAIYVHESSDVTISCNNIENNRATLYDPDEYVGLDVEISTGVSADDNWWGAADGPAPGGSGDAVYGSVTVNTWLGAEINFDRSGDIIGSAAVPAAVSLYDVYDVFGMWNEPEDYYEGDSLASLGPSYTDIIVEVNCSDTCGFQYATANVSALLLDLLPADFHEEYYLEWDGESQYFWDEWMDDLSAVAMDYCSQDGICYFDYELSLDDLLFEREDDYLDEFFHNEYGFDELYYNRLGTLLFEELRMGPHKVTVTVYTCWDSYTVDVPLSVVDFQLPMQAGWNLRSAPLTLDGNYSTFGNMTALNGLSGLQAVWTYNATSGLWVEPGLAGVMEPLSAYYIKMNASGQLCYIVNRGLTAPPTRALEAGWNLVGPASPFDYEYPEEYEDYPWTLPFNSMLPWDALFSARYAPGGLAGWSIAMNPPEELEYTERFYYNGSELDKEPYLKHFEQKGWVAFSNEEWSGGDVYLTAGGGFWVFMENAADLAGFSYTPYPWNMWYYYRYID